MSEADTRSWRCLTEKQGIALENNSIDRSVRYPCGPETIAPRCYRIRLPCWHADYQGTRWSNSLPSFPPYLYSMSSSDELGQVIILSCIDFMAVQPQRPNVYPGSWKISFKTFRYYSPLPLYKEIQTNKSAHNHREDHASSGQNRKELYKREDRNHDGLSQKKVNQRILRHSPHRVHAIALGAHIPWPVVIDEKALSEF